VRTFAFDPDGRIMLAASITPMPVRDGDHVRILPAALSVFRVSAYGTLQFVRTYDVEAG
jgi:6-phosphogluconolactonase